MWKLQIWSRFGVIATEGTIRSGAWENAIKRESSNIEVLNKACPMLAEIAEEGMAKSKLRKRYNKRVYEGV